jgi:hypothetical protein
MNFSFFDAFSQRASDVLFELLFFLADDDCCKLGSTSKILYASVSEEKLWKLLCKFRIVGFKERNSDEDLELIRDLFHFQNYRQVYYSFKFLQSPLFDLYRVIPQEHVFSFQGGLFALSPSLEDREILFREIDYRGKVKKSTETTFSLTFNPEEQIIVAHSFDNKLFKATFKSSLEFISFESNVLQRKTVFSALPPLLSASLVKSNNHFSSLPGLYSARYGSHGMEILQLSLHTSNDGTDYGFVQSTNEYWFGSLQLQGLKIVGDRNVPANQFSFLVDLTNQIHLQSVFVTDARPIIIFASDDTVTVFSEARRPFIDFISQGKGQINRNPPIWEPEWVNCVFVSYRTPVEEKKVHFSIIWENELEPFRHATDFYSLPDLDIYHLED